MKNQIEYHEETKNPFKDLETKDPLDKCLWILDYFLNNDNNNVNVLQLLHIYDYDIYGGLIDSFKKYFNSNLFNKESTQAKQDYIKSIIYQFHSFSSSIEQYTNGTSPMAVLAYEVYEGLEVPQQTKNIINAWFLFDDIMDEIQESCFILNLDLLTLCSELYISSETFVPKLALVTREKLNLIREKKPDFKIKSFSWSGTPVQLRKLFDELIDPDNGFIDPETDFKDFAAIFSGQAINDNFQGVTWVKIAQKNKSIVKNAVFTLFDSLKQAGKIPENEIQNKPELFKKLKACFCDGKTGQPLELEHSHCKYSKEFGSLIEQIISSL